MSTHATHLLRSMPTPLSRLSMQSMRSRLAVGLMSLVIIAALVPMMSLTFIPTASAHALTPRLHSDQANTEAVQLASPAVVRIVSIIEAQLICSGCLSGGGDIDSPAAGQQPFTYGSAGSGAFITPDGYILTADHVVDHTVNNPEDVNFILQAASQDIAQQYPSNTPDQILQFLENNLNRVTINMQVVLQKAFLSTAYTGQLSSTGDVQSFDVTRIVTNSPVNQDDTAIIKVEANDVPYLPIAPPNSINVGDQVTAIAYPADADDALQGQNFFALADPSQSDANTLNSLLGASVNTGQVTAKKTLSNGTPVYEAGSISSQGSSGGPVIDNQGRIIGFVDAGPSTGTDRLTFLVPSEVIAQYVKQSGNSNPTPGQFETLWTKANQEQFASGNCHWTNAASDYQKLHDEYPHFAGVDALLANAKSHATPGECSTGPSLSAGLLLGVGGGFIVLLIVVVLAVVLLTRRKKPAVAVAGVPSGAYGYTPSQPSQALPQANYALPPATPAPASTPLYQSAYPSNPMPTMPSATPYAPAPMSAPVAAPTVSGPMPAVSYQQTPSMPSVPSVAPVAPVTPAPSAPSVAVCANGHVQQDNSAQFCSQCGAPVHPAAH